MGGVPYPLLHRFGGFHWWRFYSLAGVNGLGVSPLYCFPLQVRAVVAMVKFSHLTNFVLNKKLGCIIQNCALGGCPLSTASSARWLPLVGGSFLAGFNGSGVSLVAVLFPCRVIVFHRSGSMGVSVVFPSFPPVQVVNASSARCVCQCRGDMAVIWRCGSVCPSVALWCFQ